MAQILSIGEALIDFIAVQQGVCLKDVDTFLKAAGGAPANVAVGVARLGGDIGFLGAFSDDAFGRFLYESLALEGVDISRCPVMKNVKTPLAFVSRDEKGAPTFDFFRVNTADSKLKINNIDETYIRQSRLLCFSSNSLRTEPIRSAVLKAVQIAHEAGVTTVFDLNLRLHMWDDPERCFMEVKTLLPYINILRGNENEFIALDEHVLFNKYITPLLGESLYMIIGTTGSKGCVLRGAHFVEPVEGFSVNVVDTTGSGDGFLAGLLIKLYHNIKKKKLVEITKEERYEMARFANACGALTCTKRGAIPALPTLDEVEKLL